MHRVRAYAHPRIASHRIASRTAARSFKKLVMSNSFFACAANGATVAGAADGAACARADAANMEA